MDGRGVPDSWEVAEGMGVLDSWGGVVAGVDREFWAGEVLVNGLLEHLLVLVLVAVELGAGAWVFTPEHGSTDSSFLA